MNDVACRWPFNAEARVQSQVSPCNICGGQSGSGTYFSLLSVSFRRRSTLIFIYMLLLPEGQTGGAWEHSFGNRGALHCKVLSFRRSVISRIMPQDVLTKKCNNNNAIILKTQSLFVCLYIYLSEIQLRALSCLSNTCSPRVRLISVSLATEF